MAPQHVAGVTLSVTRWIWIVWIGFTAIHYDAKPSIILKFRSNMEVAPDIHLGIATILVATTVMIWPCVPRRLCMATAADFDNIQFHAIRARSIIASLDVTIIIASWSALRGNRVKVHIHTILRL
jgi:hypothetical protein